MADHDDDSANGRRAPRQGLDGQVTIRFDAGAIVGSGQNIAAQGVFFTADGELPVAVEIEGLPEPVRGVLVRLESMGGGRIGIAVKFDRTIELPAPTAPTVHG